MATVIYHGTTGTFEIPVPDLPTLMPFVVTGTYPLGNGETLVCSQITYAHTAAGAIEATANSDSERGYTASDYRINGGS